MDPVIIAAMIFSLVVLMLLGSFALLLPVSRQLAQLVRKRVQEPNPREALSREEAEKLAQAIQQLAAGMEMLNERQDFVERLLEGRPSPGSSAQLPPANPDPVP